MKLLLSILTILCLHNPSAGQLSFLQPLRNGPLTNPLQSLTNKAIPTPNIFNPLTPPNLRNPLEGTNILPGQSLASPHFDIVKFTNKGLVNELEAVKGNSGPLGQVDVFRTTKEGVLKEVAALKDPVDKTITAVGTKQCSNVKRLLGVEYEQINYQNSEPNLSHLTLNFRTRAVSVSYNLSAAAQLIGSSGWFDPSKELKIYMHGFIDDPTLFSFTSVGSAFLQQGDYNIVALDASSLIRFLYLRASTYVRFIGERLGEVLAAMVQAGLKPSSIHLIGHSLGSHIAGFAGKTFHQLTGLRVGRISGLDPAGPCFTTVSEDLKLKSSDADFVDVIHTDDGVYGLNEQLGHVDYYPNGGSSQPSCLLQTCSHSRAWVLFSESVLTPQGFPAARCGSWTAFKKQNCNFTDTSFMGIASSPVSRGVYYLQTAGNEPFSRGAEGLRFYNNEGILKNVGSLVKEKL